MESNERIESILIDNGLLDYKWISPKDIIVAHWVRIKCLFGCADNGSGTCPPNTPSVDECDSFFKEYERGLIIRFSKFADKDAYPSAWSREITDKLLTVERDIFLMGHHKVFLLNQNCCSICKECSGDRINCKDKSKSRPSLESFAVDVFQTVRSVGFEVHVIPSSPAVMNKFALLLIE